MKRILDQFGNPLASRAQDARREIAALRRQIIKAKYDAAQTFTANELHWSNTDNLDPHSSSSLGVREKLRARSRYEIIENNPYLKGTVLSVVNDFTGSGPRIQITDKRLSKERRTFIENNIMNWLKSIKFRQKLWRMRMAKIVDGETFGFFFRNPKLSDPVQLDIQVIETDRIGSDEFFARDVKHNEIDGIRFDEFNNPTEYHLMNMHPGSSLLTEIITKRFGGKWIDAKFVVHWFRQDRGWLRGIPELAPSLSLCALLRRYTLAVVRAAEIAAGHSAVLQTDGKPSTKKFTGGADGDSEDSFDDEPFDTIPFTHGMMTVMPDGYELNQLKHENPSAMFDKFVDMLLREIVRPLNAPFNIAAGSSADSNMASAIVDAHLYRGGISQERFHGEEEVLDPVVDMYWRAGVIVPDLFDETIPGDDGSFLTAFPELLTKIPSHRWRWDEVGLQHTDPVKVAKARQIEQASGNLLDVDVQQRFYNRPYEEWKEDLKEEKKFRDEIGAPIRVEELDIQDDPSE